METRRGTNIEHMIEIKNRAKFKSENPKEMGPSARTVVQGILRNKSMRSALHSLDSAQGPVAGSSERGSKLSDSVSFYFHRLIGHFSNG